MTQMQNFCFIICSFFVLFPGSALQADGLYVRHATGGQASSLVVGNGYWYQALGEQLLVLKKNGGEIVTTVPLASKATAHCTDLFLDGNRLYALLDGSEVVVLDIQEPPAPSISDRMSEEALGVVPRQFGTVGKLPVVFGEGGVVRLRDGQKLVDWSGIVTGAATTSKYGDVFTSGNNLYDGDSGELLGIATCLFELDESANANIGTLLYTLNFGDETEVGLMTSDLMPLGTLGKEMLSGKLENVFVRGSRVYVVTTSDVYVLGIAPKELRLLRTFDVAGVRDIGIAASNYFAMCGSFGRGLFRIAEDSGGAGETLFRVMPANGAISAGVFDERGVQVETEDGSLYYSFGGELSPCYSDHSSQLMNLVQVPTRAVVLGGEAVISESGSVTLHTSEGDTELTLPSPAITVVAIAGDFWFGTENGIYIVGQLEDEPLLIGLQLAGPIVQLIPLLDGTVGFVSGAGVVGVVARR